MPFEINVPAVAKSTEIRPISRDLGFLLIGLALGVGAGWSFAGMTDVRILIPIMALTIAGLHFIYKTVRP